MAVEGVITSSLIIDISIVIIIATIGAFLARVLKQPLIPAYILAGILIGPVGLGLIKDLEIIKTLSEMGIAFLLFIVGLEINFNKLKRVSKVAILGGAIQVMATFFAGYFLSIFFGFSSISAVYLGLVIAFSSTMVVIKLLSDRKRLDTLHGRIIIGILLMQDLLVIIALAVLPTYTNPSIFLISIAIAKGLLLLAIGRYCSKYIFPTFFRIAAKSQEIIFLTSLSTLFLFILLSILFDFSIVIGAFVAGISLANLPYNFDIIGKIISLKDFFSTIFFVSLGMQLVLIGRAVLMPMIYLLIAVILLKPLLIMIITSAFGYEKRTSFLTSISLGQVSEFSLIMATLGFYSFGHITRELFSLIIFLTIITITITSYLIKNEYIIYNALKRPLDVFEKLSSNTIHMNYSTKKGKNIVLFGCNRMGSYILEAMKKEGKKVLVVDHNPAVINNLRKKGQECIYGDVMNEEIIEKINLEKAKILVSTIPSENDNEFLIKKARELNKKIIIIAIAHKRDEALNLYELGADYVLVPFIIGGKRLSSLLKRLVENKLKIKDIRNSHVKEILYSKA